MKFGFCKIRNVAAERLGILMKALAHENPSHVRPPLAVDRRMRVALFIGKLVMNAMRRDPENWATLERKGPASGQEIFNPRRCLVAAMREQPVIAHADSEAAGHPPKEHRNKQCFPGKKENCRYCAQMECQHEPSCDPIDLVVLTRAFERFNLQFHPTTLPKNACF